MALRLAVLGGLALHSWRRYRASVDGARAAAAGNDGPAPMTRKQRRLTVLALGLAALGAATALVLAAFNENLVFFYGPSELAAKAVGPDRRIRIGGLVEAQSLQDERRPRRRVPRHRRQERLRRSSMTAFCRTCSARGRASSPRANCAADGVFVASSVLAKHDEKYMPREVADALKKAGRWQEGGPPPGAAAAPATRTQ